VRRARQAEPFLNRHARRLLISCCRKLRSRIERRTRMQ